MIMRISTLTYIYQHSSISMHVSKPLFKLISSTEGEQSPAWTEEEVHHGLQKYSTPLMAGRAHHGG